MGEQDREFIRHQLETFNTEQEVCDLLGITVEELLRRFSDELETYAEGDHTDD